MRIFELPDGPCSVLDHVTWLNHANLLCDNPSQGLDMVVWSGTLGPSLFAGDVRNWSPQAHARLHETLDRLVSRGARVTVRPHARHILSDHFVILKFFEERSKRNDYSTRVLLDPMSLFVAAMLPRRTNHLERMFHTFRQIPREESLGLVVANIQGPSAASDIDEGEPLALVPLERGLFDPMEIIEHARSLGDMTWYVPKGDTDTVLRLMQR